jgi:hypothetical protein
MSSDNDVPHQSQYLQQKLSSSSGVIRNEHRISIWLKAFIIWQVGISTFGILIYAGVGNVLLSHVQPWWLFPLDILSFIGFIICMIAVWKRKRWGVYGTTVLYAIKFFENLWTYQIGNGFLNLIYVIILWLLLISIWDYMD